MTSMNAGHRQWPLPDEPWLMKQTWESLLFAHWEVKPSDMQRRIPAQLTLDTYDGMAWIGVIPFAMSGIHARGLPPIPGTSAFLEINVRTYVTYQGKPGVYFFSLDASHRLAVALARRILHLPYYHAEMNIAFSGNEAAYRSRRIHRNAPLAEFSASYAPISPVYEAERGSLESWLVNRYCLYNVYKGRVYRGEINHEPWPLQKAEADIRMNRMAEPYGLPLASSAPLLHFSGKLDAFIWPFHPCDGNG